MSRYLANRDGGKTDEHGLSRALSQVIGGAVISGLKVRERSSPNLSIDVETGDIAIDSGLGYRYCAWNDAVYNIVLTTADPTNPRKDLIVGYIDKSVVQSTTSNNVDAFKIVTVTGTPAGSPVEPNAGAIQTAVGSGNPYSILALVDVPANDTIITNSQITDRRERIPALNKVRQFFATELDFWETGCAITIVSGLNIAVSGGVVWLDGHSVDVSALSSTGMVASRDNYIDVDKNGNIVNTDVANNATSPTLQSGRIRIGIVVSGASSISVINQGGSLATAPTVSSEILNVSDSLGNLICPQKSQKTLSYRRRTTAFTTTSTSDVLLTGLSATVRIPDNVRRIKVRVVCRAMFNNSSGYAGLSVYDGVIGSGGVKVYQQYSGGIAGAASLHVPSTQEVVLEVAPNSTKTIQVGATALTTGTATFTTEGTVGQGDIALSVEVA